MSHLRPGPGGVPASPAPALLLPLAAEAARRTRVSWVSYDTGGHRVSERLVWHAWVDDALVVLSHPDEQDLPGAEEVGEVEVASRGKETGGLLVRWLGAVEVLADGDPRREGHLTALVEARLNLPDPAASRRAWAASGVVWRVVPTALLSSV